MNSRNKKSCYKVISDNRKARYEYHILDSFEAGISLLGSEVKSIREGKVNINEAFLIERNNEVFVHNMNISEYKGSNRFNHEPKRHRKLLLHRKEINKIMGQIKIKGYTAIVLKLYFNEKNKVKLEIALAKGKQNFDKRESIKKREVQREQGRVLRESRQEKI